LYRGRQALWSIVAAAEAMRTSCIREVSELIYVHVCML
jgi:hypothetical protein